MSISFVIALVLAAVAGCSKQSSAPAELEPPNGAPPERARLVSADHAPAPLDKEPTAKEPTAKEPTAKKLVWYDDLAEAQVQASQQERDLFIDFSAVWCAPCKEMEETTFADAQTAKLLGEHFVPLKLDVSEQSDADLALMKRFAVKILPALLVVRNEKILLAIDTYVDAKELQAQLTALPPREQTHAR